MNATDRIRHARLLKAARLASLGALVPGIVHDLVSPLNSIILHAQLALELARGSAGTEMEALLHTMLDDCKRATKITTRATRYMEGPTSAPARAPVRGIVRRALEACGPNLRGREIAVEEAVPGCLEIHANRFEIEQVLISLITGAVEAGARWVELRARALDADVELQLSDDGADLDDAALAELFEPALTGRAAPGGSGLGLMLCRHILEGQDGRISVRRRAGGGCSVLLRLPAAADESD